MALKSERFAKHDAHGGEESPTVDQAGLSGREADFFDGQQLVVMKDVAMNQVSNLMAACLAGEWDKKYCNGIPDGAWSAGGVDLRSWG